MYSVRFTNAAHAETDLHVKEKVKRRTDALRFEPLRTITPVVKPSGYSRVSILLKEPVQIARSMIDVQHFDSLEGRPVKNKVVFKAGNGKEANIAQERIPVFSCYAKTRRRGHGFECFTDRFDDPRGCVRIVLRDERPNVPKLALDTGSKDEFIDLPASPLSAGAAGEGLPRHRHLARFPGLRCFAGVVLRVPRASAEPQEGAAADLL